ncbi:dihydroneopterin aldolase [Inquilinus sp. KBS0705]|nr:dihydroneopterin aldolase [Inquilinus sp. KBS0705]
MITVGLQGAEFFAYHGFYPEEQLTGTHFLVDIQVAFDTGTNLSDDNISHTVNYETLYEIADAEMQEPKKLIETVAQAILTRVTTAFTFIQTAEVTIRKLNPPFKGPVKYSVITLNYHK